MQLNNPPSAGVTAGAAGCCDLCICKIHLFEGHEPNAGVKQQQEGKKTPQLRLQRPWVLRNDGLKVAETQVKM